MRHCAIGVKSRNGIEAQRYKARATCTRSAQLLINGQLRDALMTQGRFEPGKELAKRSAILLHGLADVNRIIKALLRLGERGWIQPLNERHLTAYVVEQTASDACRIYQQSGRGRQCSQSRIDLGVITQIDAIALKGVTQLNPHLFQINKQRRPVRLNQCKRDKDRVKRNIRPTQVKQPGNIIQRGDKMRIGVTLLKRFAQLRQLVYSAHGGLRW